MTSLTHYCAVSCCDDFECIQAATHFGKPVPIGLRAGSDTSLAFPALVRVVSLCPAWSGLLDAMRLTMMDAGTPLWPERASSSSKASPTRPLIQSRKGPPAAWSKTKAHPVSLRGGWGGVIEGLPVASGVSKLGSRMTWIFNHFNRNVFLILLPATES
jgi:hypothetical protein